MNFIKNNITPALFLVFCITFLIAMVCKKLFNDVELDLWMLPISSIFLFLSAAFYATQNLMRYKLCGKFKNLYLQTVGWFLIFLVAMIIFRMSGDISKSGEFYGFLAKYNGIIVDSLNPMFMIVVFIIISIYTLMTSFINKMIKNYCKVPNVNRTLYDNFLDWLFTSPIITFSSAILAIAVYGIFFLRGVQGIENGVFSLFIFYAFIFFSFAWVTPIAFLTIYEKIDGEHRSTNKNLSNRSDESA